MSKTSQKQRMKLLIREQEGQIKHLEALNHHLIMRLNSMTFKQYKQYAVAMYFHQVQESSPLNN